MDKSTSKPGRKIFNLILLAGIFIRLLLMPFFTHQDLLSTYTKASKLVFEGRLCPGFFGVFWLGLHGFFLKLFSLFFPKIKNVLMTDYAMKPLLGLIYQSPLILRTIFLLKTPFLIFDLLSIFLILRFFQNDTKKLLAFGFWMFNPITIFTFYMQGRGSYSFFLFFTVLSFLFWKKKKFLASFLSLGLATTLRPYALIFLPVFMLKLKDKLIRKIKYLVIALLPLSVDMILMRLLADRSFIPLQKLPSPSQLLMTANLEVGGLPHRASLLVAIYIFFYLWLSSNPKIKNNWRSLVNLSLLSIIPWFGLGFIQPQIFSWLALFFTFLVAQNSRYISLYFLILISWLMVVLNYGKALGLGLLSPLNNFVFSNHVASLRTLFYLYFPEYNLTHLGRSLLLGTLLFLSYRLLKEFSEETVLKNE